MSCPAGLPAVTDRRYSEVKQLRQGANEKAPCQTSTGLFKTLSEPFSSFLRGASCLKSPRTYRGQNLYRHPRGRQVELFQLVSGGISRFENVGSAVLEESWCSHRLVVSVAKTSSNIIMQRRSMMSFRIP